MSTDLVADPRTLAKVVLPVTLFADAAAVRSFMTAHGVPDYRSMQRTDGAWVTWDGDLPYPPAGPHDVEVIEGALVHFEPIRSAPVIVAAKGTARPVRVVKGEVSASGNVFETAPASTAPTEAERIAKLPADVRRLAANHNLSADNAESLAKVLTASGPIAADRINPAALLHLRGLWLIQERADGVMGVRMIEPGIAAKVERATKAYEAATLHPTLASRPRPATVATKASGKPAMDRALLGSMFGTRA